MRGLVKTHGISGWTYEQFVAAMREGKTPDGSVYYPAFPYSSYTGMRDADLKDLCAYLRTVPAVAEASGEDGAVALAAVGLSRWSTLLALALSPCGVWQVAAARAVGAGACGAGGPTVRLPSLAVRRPRR